MCELAGIDGVCVVHRGAPDERVDPLAALATVAAVTATLELGISLADAPGWSLAGRSVRPATESESESERGATAEAAPSLATRGLSPSVLSALERVVTGPAARRLELTLPAEPEAIERVRDLRSSIRLGLRLTACAADECALAVSQADTVVLTAAALQARHRAAGISIAADVAAVVSDLRIACTDRGRNPVTMDVALEVPVSIGRTTAEATARAAAEPLFRDSRIGLPREVGLFGTLEECQAGVAQLAHAGVSELRCWLPNSPDLPDVIAQLTAMVVGKLEASLPNAPRSPDPAPPEGWGGRSRFPRR
jgi:hypothetical protein